MGQGLTAKQRAFVAAYIGVARGVALQAAKIAGYDAKDDASFGVIGCENLKKPNVVAAIDAWRAEVKAEGVASLEYRLSRLDALERKYFDLIDARAEAYKDVAGAIGGATGLIIGQLKKVTHVREPGDGDDGPLTWTEEQWEYVADTAVTKEIRAVYEDTAKELGQRKDTLALSGDVGVRRYIGVDPEAV